MVRFWAEGLEIGVNHWNFVVYSAWTGATRSELADFSAYVQSYLDGWTMTFILTALSTIAIDIDT